MRLCWRSGKREVSWGRGLVVGLRALAVYGRWMLLFLWEVRVSHRLVVFARSGSVEQM